MGEITYEDIERNFSKEDLTRYNLLCREFVTLTANKNNAELWNLVQSRSRLWAVLNEIHALRGKYDFLNGILFFKVWKVNPNTGYEEVCW
jgi:hypothetical protein